MLFSGLYWFRMLYIWMLVICGQEVEALLLNTVSISIHLSLPPSHLEHFYNLH